MSFLCYFIFLCRSICMFVCGFFFFKQKTAYEMRISDWSSDVCSSDLPTLLIVGALDGPVIELNHQAQDRLQCKTELVTVPGASHLFEEPGTLDIVELGRASCRERVCQSV